MKTKYWDVEKEGGDLKWNFDGLLGTDNWNLTALGREEFFKINLF